MPCTAPPRVAPAILLATRMPAQTIPSDAAACCSTSNAARRATLLMAAGTYDVTRDPARLRVGRAWITIPGTRPYAHRRQEAKSVDHGMAYRRLEDLEITCSGAHAASTA